MSGLPRCWRRVRRLNLCVPSRCSMAIYGTALLSICLLVGLSLGRWLGSLAGMDSDIGGVGIAILLLIAGCDFLHRTGRLRPPTEAGIAFWSSIYVPIVVAMAASQNVLAAVTAGWVALLAGLLTVIVCFGLVGFLTRFGQAGPGEEK
jgi:malonate transporter MadL subunit